MRSSDTITKETSLLVITIWTMAWFINIKAIFILLRDACLVHRCVY